MKHIIFLRAVNVGSHNRINMRHLTEILPKSGFTGTKTYIQSGNIVLESHENNPAETISKTILNNLGLEVTAITRSPAELAEIIKNNPYPPEKTYITMFAGDLASKLTENDAKINERGDLFTIAGNNIYILSNGPYHQTTFSNNYFEKKTGLQATTRNLRTIKKLLDLSRENK